MAHAYLASAKARPAAVAGRFYPREPKILRDQLSGFFHAARAQGPTEDIKALVVPHAGYVYSGAVAAEGYRLLAPQADVVERVVLLGPAHTVYVAGMAVPSWSTFQTPLGVVNLDHDLMERANHVDGMTVDDEPHAREHALEVQLPFLQSVLPHFTLLPVVVGDAPATTVAELLHAVWGGPETLIVISSDMSHYLPAEVARRVDHETLQTVLQLEPRLTSEDACGATPLNGFLLAAKDHGLRPTLLDARNSGDVSGDDERVVGYAALCFS